MQLVTFKLQQDIIKKIDTILKPKKYNNRTEFIREAIRDKLNKIEDQYYEARLRKYLGAGRKKGQPQTTDAEMRNIREEVSKELIKKWGLE